MRATTRALIDHYVEHLDLSGQVLEIGGHRLASCLIEAFPEPRFAYHDLNIAPSDIPNTIIADITGCADEIEDDRFDLIFSSDVFEHIDRPWLAAEEIGRILKPGGVVVTHTLFSWRNHPCPIDYWRYSAECLEFLFSDLETLEKGYDLSQRRNDQPGFWESGNDSVPVDALGGWREHWSVWHVGRKGGGPDVPPFRESDHPQARWLRMDTQGRVTNPTMLGGPKHVPADDVTAELTALRQEVAALRRAATVPLPVRAASQLAGAARRGVRRGISRVR